MRLLTNNIFSPRVSGDGREGGRRFSTVQLLLAIIVAIGLLLALNFSSRIQLDRELQVIHAGVVAEIATLIEDQQQLIHELTYVKSDAYVEFWARDEGKMIRDGEILILPQSGGIVETAPDPNFQLVEFVTTAPEPENWELWWALFFDSPPPQLR